MSEIKIEKGIEVPKRIREKGSFLVRWPFDKMEVGDSFLIETTRDNHKKKLVGASRAARYFMSRYSPKSLFIVRSIIGGFRVWRIK